MTPTIDSTTHRSPNHSPRNGAAITSIVCHSCEGKLPSPRVSSLPWLCNPQPAHPERRVSCHYYVCRNGEIYQLVDDGEAAWHAGAAQSAYTNERSIGVELEHRSGMNYPPAQRDALAWLLRRLMDAHQISADRIDTHGQIAIKGPYDRKHDPSDWDRDQFRAFVAALVPAPAFNAARYRVRAIQISTKSTGGPPYAGEVQAGEFVEIDATYPSGWCHLRDGRGFVLLSSLEPAGAL